MPFQHCRLLSLLAYLPVVFLNKLIRFDIKNSFFLPKISPLMTIIVGFSQRRSPGGGPVGRTLQSHIGHGTAQWRAVWAYPGPTLLDTDKGPCVTWTMRHRRVGDEHAVSCGDEPQNSSCRAKPNQLSFPRYPPQVREEGSAFTAQ